MHAFGKALGGGRRGAQRAQAPLLALVATVVNVHRAAIMNVSTRGAQPSAPDLPSEGQDLLFRADTVQAFGKVVWARDNQCGIELKSRLTRTNSSDCGGLLICRPIRVCRSKGICRPVLSTQVEPYAGVGF